MKYRKKPVEVDVMRWNGSHDAAEIIQGWSKGAVALARQTEIYKEGDKKMIRGWFVLKIRTLEGVMVAQEGDFIVCGVRGEYYPCKPDIFEETYEKVA